MKSTKLCLVVLHGESNTSQASPRMTIQRMCQPQEAVQPKQNQIILQPVTPAQKGKKIPYTVTRSRRTHVSRTQECALTRLVTGRVTTQLLEKHKSCPDGSTVPCCTSGQTLVLFHSSSGPHAHLECMHVGSGPVCRQSQPCCSVADTYWKSMNFFLMGQQYHVAPLVKLWCFSTAPAGRTHTWSSCM